jgi:hypothetical protein
MFSTIWVVPYICRWTVSLLLNILFAEGKTGFIPDALPIFKPGSKTGNYHA